MCSATAAAAARQASVSSQRLESVNLSILKLQMKGRQMATVGCAEATRPSICFISLKWKMTRVDCMCVCTHKRVWIKLKKKKNNLAAGRFMMGSYSRTQAKHWMKKQFTRLPLLLLLMNVPVKAGNGRSLHGWRACLSEKARKQPSNSACV